MGEAHAAILQEGLQAIDRSFLGKLEKQLLKERFERKLQEQLQEAKGRASRHRNRNLRTLLEAEEASGGEPGERLEQAIVRMAQLSETATRDDNLYCEFYLYLCELSRSLLEETVSTRHQQEQVFSNRVSLMEEQIGQLRRQL
jgi:Arc/MetJ family transcription regulator